MLLRTVGAMAVCAALIGAAGPGALAQKSKDKKKSGSKAKATSNQPPGGANQVQGLNGKVGQMLFTGRWRFQVHDYQMVDSYTLKVPTSEQDYAKYHDVAEYDSATHTFKPKEGYTFVAVNALVKNGQTSTQQLGCYLGDPKTAVTDNKENSYPPIAYDMVSKGAWVTRPLLPGSGEQMTVLFAVPKGTELKDLVFSLNNWSDSKGKDVRISLAKYGTIGENEAGRPSVWSGGPILRQGLRSGHNWLFVALSACRSRHPARIRS